MKFIIRNYRVNKSPELDNITWQSLISSQVVQFKGATSKCGTNGIDATEGRACKSEDGARHFKKSDGVLCAGISVKYAWIERHKSYWPVSRQCEVLNVSTSGYFGHQRRRIADNPAIPGKRISDTALLIHIKAVHAASKGEYGWPRVWRELRANCVRVWKERVRRLMKEHDIKARGKRKFIVTTDSKHSLPIAPNLLNRNFQPDAPNRVWTSDITYIQTDAGWLYLAVVLDLYSRGACNPICRAAW